MYFLGSIIGALLIGLVPGFIAYCIVEGKTKSKTKALIALIIVALLVCILKVFVLGNINLFNKESGTNTTNVSTALEETTEEPKYFAFNEINILLNPETSTYYEVEDATDLSFEYEDENGELQDWSDDEKQKFWNEWYFEEPYNYAMLQAFISSDMIMLASLDISDCQYTSVDEYVAEIENTCDKEDFNIGDIHACTLYFDNIDDKKKKADSSMTIFYYKDKMYQIIVNPVLGDLESILNESVKTIKLK